MNRESSFASACARLDDILTGTVRRDLVATVTASTDLRRALTRLRDSMRVNVWIVGGREINLNRFVEPFDALTRREGFHVLHDWDGKAEIVNEHTIPVDVLDYVARTRGTDPPDATAVAILLDYYLVHILALLSVRIWDDGDADRNLDRLNELLAALQGPGGSGQPFVQNAETLILIATSHFELQERGYDLLLDRVRTLNAVHQTNIAVGHAASMGSHLRFGFEATYVRDTVVMRDDNAADYPWLCFALATVMREFSRLGEGPGRDAIAEALLDGLSADARAFVGEPPPSLARCEKERAAFHDLFLRHRDDLVAAFERMRPSDAYSPVAFFFNFSHNVVKGMVVDAALKGQAWPLTFNDLLTGLPAGDARNATRKALAETLMGYARANPDRIRGRLMPVIVYDPDAGRQAFSVMMRKVRE
jgi:hypothetical protein